MMINPATRQLRGGGLTKEDIEANKKEYLRQTAAELGW